MTLEDQPAKADYQRMRVQVAAAQQAYHTNDAPIMADGDYDELVKVVQAIEEAHPEWTLGQPVANVVGGATKRGLYAVKHKVPMLSLDNVFSVAELQDVMAGWKVKPSQLCDVSYKYDGLACSLTYLDQTLVEAATRGDRFEGESILHNIFGFDSVPKSLPTTAPDHIEVRGELLLFNDEFEAYNARLVALGRPPAVNPRNAAAGLARRLKQDKLPGAQLVFFPYAVIYHSGGRPATFGETMLQLAKWGFEMPYSPGTLKPYDDHHDPDRLLNFIDAQQEVRKTLPFGIDGLVLRLEDYDKCDELGFTSRAPRWAIAYKFPAEEKGTKVTGIRIQVGRTGNVTPVAEVEPVLVGGVTVTNATLHNEDHINALGIAIGDEVIIRRAGDVVPEIAKVIARPADRKVWTFPSNCDCGEELVRPEGQANHLCRNQDCHHRVQRAFEHYVSRNAMDIEGLGEELIEKLLLGNKIRWFDDLYKLTEQDILDVTTASSKRYAESIIEAINKSRKTTMRRFIYALGIQMVGEGTAKRLHEFFGRFDILTGARPPLLLAVPDVGPGAAQAIDNYFDAAMWFYDFLEKRPEQGRPSQQFPYGKIEFTDEQGPSPDFAKYHDPLELMKLAGIRGITAKKSDEIRDWCRRMGYLQDDAYIMNLPLEGDNQKAQQFFDDNREALSVVKKCWQLVDNNMEFVRKPAHNQPLAGNTYVLTGSFEDTLGVRGELSKQLEHLGAKVSGSVSAKTTAVFVGESPGANKIDAASKYAVPVLQAHDLQTLLQESQ